jgi:hypothetical protein
MSQQQAVVALTSFTESLYARQPAGCVSRACRRQGHLALVPDAIPTVSLPPIGLALEGRTQQTLPGVCWPAAALTQAQRPGRPIISVWEINKKEAERLLIAWRHELHLNGERYTRPFGSMFFLMEVMGRPAAVVVLASSCNEWVSKERNLRRYDCVDIARLCRSPDRRDDFCLRAVLRLSREYLVPLYPIRYPKKWSVIRAACANSLPSTASARPDGKTGMYRFDGWVRIRVTKGKGGGGKRGRPSKAAEIGDGNRGLWVYFYPGLQPTPTREPLGEPPQLHLAA